MATTVTFTATNTLGTPLKGAVLTAFLNGKDWDNGVLVPSITAAETGADGNGSISLWPNTAGTGGTTYTLRLTHPAIRPVEWTSIVVPDVASIALTTLVGGLVPVPWVLSLDGAQLSVIP